MKLNEQNSLKHLHNTYFYYENIIRFQENFLAFYSDQDLLIISDEKVWDIYGENFLEFISQKLPSSKIHFWIGPDGESIKSIHHFENCLEYFLEKKIHRKFKLIAFGGGSVSDFAGFVASSLLRGLSFSIIPTTLLSAVDASIGGKVAINSNYGKNLIGTFYQPEKVLFCQKFLETLPNEEIHSGLGEVVKYLLLHKKIYNEFLSMKVLIENISQESPSFYTLLSKTIKNCVSYKIEIVKNDPYEQDQRRILNLGHTLGHAFEKFININNEVDIKFRHGIAVLAGIEFILNEWSDLDESGFLKDQFIEILTILKLPKSPLKYTINIFNEKCQTLNLKRELGIIQLLNYIESDKKRENCDKISIVILKSLGHPDLISISLKELKEKVHSLMIKNIL